MNKLQLLEMLKTKKENIEFRLEQIEDRIARIRSQATSTTSQITGMPYNPSTEMDRIGKSIATAEEYEQRMLPKVWGLETEKTELMTRMQATIEYAGTDWSKYVLSEFYIYGIPLEQIQKENPGRNARAAYEAGCDCLEQKEA